MEVFDVFATFGLLDNITGPLGNIRSGFAQTEASGGRLSTAMGSLTKSMLPFIAAAGIFLATLAPAVGTAANFEAAISGVGAVSGATTAQMQTLEQAALDLGASTAWSASEVASAEKSLAMAGFEVAENVAALPGVLDLASAAQFDLGETANIASNILSSFSMEASQMGKVADILTTTFTSSNTTLASLSSTMANAGPVAAAAGASLAEVAAMAGKLGDVGIDASVAGTGIKIMFQRLQAPTGEAAKALKNFGIATKDASGDMLPIFDVLGDLETAMDGMGTADKAALLKKIFGDEAVGSIQALMTQGIDTVKEYATTLEIPGKAAEVAARQLDNFHGATTILGSGFEALQISIGKIFLPVLTIMVKGLTTVVGWLNDLASHPIGKFFIGFAAAIAAGVVVMGIFSAAMWGAALAAGALNLSLLANPIVLIGAAIVGVAVLISSYWGDIAAFFTGVFATIEAEYHRFMGIWQMDGLSTAFSNLWASMSDGCKSALGVITSVAVAIGTIFLGPIALIGAAVAGLVGTIIVHWDEIGSFFSGLWDSISSAASAAFDVLADLFLNFTPLGLLIKNFDEIVNYLSSIDLSECGRKLWSTFTDGLKSMISAPVEIVKSGLQAIRNMLPFSDAKTGPLSTLTLSGQRLMTTIAGGVGTGASALADAVGSALDAPGKLLEAGIGALSVPIEMASTVRDAISLPVDVVNQGAEAFSVPVDMAAQPMLEQPFMDQAPEPALVGAAPVEVKPITSKSAPAASKNTRSSSKSGGGITIQNLTLHLHNVSDVAGFQRELQQLVERYDG